MPFAVRKDIVEKTCRVCRKFFWTEGLGAKYCSEKCHFFQFLLVDDGCWGWAGVKHDFGYGQFLHGRGNRFFAHRFAYEYFVGPIPDKLLVCHSCDNPVCCKPSHLFLGTSKRNTADMMEKGRNGWGVSKGTANKQSKLTEEQVRHILSSPEQTKILANKYGVVRTTIQVIRRRQNWKHITLS